MILGYQCPMTEFLKSQPMWALRYVTTTTG